MLYQIMIMGVAVVRLSAVLFLCISVETIVCSLSANSKSAICNLQCRHDQLVKAHRQHLEDKLRQRRRASEMEGKRGRRDRQSTGMMRETTGNQDDLTALVSLYKSTNGENWVNNSGWKNGMSGDPCVQEWYGVWCNNDNRVIGVEMVYNQMSGRLPEDLARADQLQHLVLYSNALTGPIPTNLFSLPNLVEINLNFNQLSGTLPSQLRMPKLESLILYANSLSGQLPEVWEMSNLTDLEVAENKFTGVFPAAIGSLKNLQLLVASRNNLTGMFPSSLGHLTHLTKLWLFSNELKGPLPDLSKLQAMVDCQMDGINGSLPDWLGSNWQKLQHLVIVRGSITGHIPESLCDSLHLNMLWLFQNRLKGEIPDCLGRLKSLSSLELSDNMLSGSIPESLGEASNLTDLYLSRNNLTGEIPTSLGSLRKLLILDVSSNMLVGGIPASFANFDKQVFSISLCYNELSGPIPESLESFFKFIFDYTCNLYNNPWSCPLPTFVPNSCGCSCSDCNGKGNHTSCSHCTSYSNCGYCTYGSNCLEGTDSGPSDYTCPSAAGQWIYGSNQC